LRLYYPEDLVEKALAALDVLSRESEATAFDDLLNAIRHRPQTLALDPNGLLEVLNILKDDYYLIESSGGWRFKVELVRAWWFENRGKLGL
jgi:hypothetical protein